MQSKLERKLRVLFINFVANYTDEGSENVVDVMYVAHVTSIVHHPFLVHSGSRDDEIRQKFFFSLRH